MIQFRSIEKRESLFIFSKKINAPVTQIPGGLNIKQMKMTCYTQTKRPNCCHAQFENTTWSHTTLHGHKHVLTIHYNNDKSFKKKRSCNQMT